MPGTLTAMTLEALYFANPMCSWCWGFAPSLAAARDAFGPELRVTLALGSLGDRGGRPMRPEEKRFVREHWEHVVERSGQPFDFAFFDREGFVYDTEPACRAVVTARRLMPRMALPFMARVQQAFYAESRDMTAAGELSQVAEEAGFDRARFGEVFNAGETKNETFRDFMTAQALGIHGFPTLIAGSEERGYALVTNGFRHLEELAEPLERWLAAGAPVTKAE
jgi:putative protein-disulfide isomerase